MTTSLAIVSANGTGLVRWRPEKASAQCTFDTQPGTTVGLAQIEDALIRLSSTTVLAN
jgi:hypothetical protein